MGQDGWDRPDDLPLGGASFYNDILAVIADGDGPVATSTVLTALWEGKHYRERFDGDGGAETLHHRFRTLLYEVLDWMNENDVIAPVERPHQEPIPEVAWQVTGDD